ncbi:46380_t:CDS:1, partial [Gigaspora margarita]
FLSDTLFDSEEVNSNFSQESSDSIVTKHYEKILYLTGNH